MFSVYMQRSDCCSDDHSASDKSEDQRQPVGYRAVIGEAEEEGLGAILSIVFS
jgi:hypothetical protein